MPVQTAHARTRRAIRPRVVHRRVSGPLRAAPAGAPVRRGATGVFERLRALPETRVIDGLLRGRAWIWLIGVLLGGIVAMQVSLLNLNAGISRAVTTAGTLERQNADLEARIAKLSSSDRVEEAAAANGMITPAAGGVGYLTARPDRDAALAARRMRPPSEDATAVMENGGQQPGVVAAAPVIPGATPDPAAATAVTTATPMDPTTATSAATADPTTATPTATPDPTTVTPAATPDPTAVTPASTPEPTATPVPDTVAPGQG